MSAGRLGLGPPGFSIIETLGVLALIAILGAVTAYSSLARLKSSHQEREQASLVTLARAFENAVIRSRLMPAGGNWAGAVVTRFLATPDHPTATTTTDAACAAVQNSMSACIAGAQPGSPSGGCRRTAVQSARTILQTATSHIVTLS